MKKLIGSIIIASLIIIYGCCGCGNYKYSIWDSAGHIFRTNEITYQGSCIKFVNMGDSHKHPMVLCGGYTIEENKNWKPEKK